MAVEHRGSTVAGGAGGAILVAAEDMVAASSVRARGMVIAPSYQENVPHPTYYYH